jgi:phosphoribosylanthranilate isomerase|tara:strand:- start:215 stop:853 length:639 start_codon:yes stop_codon:yes gene_type:complete
LNKSKIKICGINEIKIINCCINNGIEYCGLIFYEKSPRFVNLELAKKIINYVYNKKIIPVGVFVDKPLNEIKKIIEKTCLKHIQLHGNEDNDYINQLKKEFDLKIIKSIGINNKDDLKKMDDLQLSDYFLFDYKPIINELPGGNAKRFDWSLLQNITISKPWFISGGINIGNIGQIDKKLIPYGIDISSGVEEKPGIKSSHKINALLKILNA